MYHYLQQSLLIITSLGFGLIYFAHLRTRMFWRAPFFASYAACACLFGLLLSLPHDATLLFIAEPLLLSLRVSMVIEAFIIATDGICTEAKRWAFLALLLPSIVVVLVFVLLQYYPGSTEIAFYRAARLHVHVGLAGACVFGALALSTEPPPLPNTVRAHCLTLICYFVSHAIINLTVPETNGEWQFLRVVALGSCCLCIWYWLRHGLASRVPLFQVLNSAA